MICRNKRSAVSAMLPLYTVTKLKEIKIIEEKIITSDIKSLYMLLQKMRQKMNMVQINKMGKSNAKKPSYCKR